MEYEKIIAQIAEKNHTTPEEVEAEMQIALHAAKDNPNFKIIFGGRMPTVEEFIQTIAGSFSA